MTLSCRNISASYTDGSGAVITNLSLSLSPGEHTVILGKNGCGKTTLLRILSGELRPTEGDVFCDGMPLNRLSTRQKAQKIAVVPQHFEASSRLSVHDFVLLGRYPYLKWWRGYSSADNAVVNECIKIVNAEKLQHRSVSGLSGGEYQRVLLARALAQQGKCLLLDELTSGLDYSIAVHLLNMLDTLRKKGLCICSVMHDANLAALFATRLIGMHQGRIIFEGEVNAVFTEDNLCRVYETGTHVIRHPRYSVPQMCLDRDVIL